MINPTSTFFQLLSDPDEGRFLQALLGHTEGDQLLMEYADFLSGRDDVRAEFLSLECRLSGTGSRGEVTLERQARYQELLHLLGNYSAWLRAVRRSDRLLNCGLAATQPLTVRFRYQCPNQWETLAPTQEPGVRYCEGCERSVFFCASAETVELHARKGHCIAVAGRVTASVHEELTRHFTGMPDVHDLWGRKLFET